MAGFYTWKRRPPSNSSSANDETAGVLRKIHTASRGTYGRPRLHRALNAAGYACSPERVRRLMLKHGIASKHRRKYRATTNSRHDFPVAKNLVKRGFHRSCAEPTVGRRHDFYCDIRRLFVPGGCA